MAITRKLDETDKQLRERLRWNQPELKGIADIMKKIGLLPSNEIEDLMAALSMDIMSSVEADLFGKKVGAVKVESLEETLKNVMFNGLNAQLGNTNVKSKGTK